MLEKYWEWLISIENGMERRKLNKENVNGNEWKNIQDLKINKVWEWISGENVLNVEKKTCICWKMNIGGSTENGKRF